MCIRDSGWGCHAGRFGRIFLPDLFQAFSCPVGQMFFLENADEITPVPPGSLPVTEAGGVYRSARGAGGTAKAAGRQPELILWRPIGLPQSHRTHNQHLALQLLPGHIVAVRTVKQVQLCLCFPEGADKTVQHSGVTLHRKLVIAVAGRDEGGCRPCFILKAESSIVQIGRASCRERV